MDRRRFLAAVGVTGAGALLPAVPVPGLLTPDDSCLSPDAREMVRLTINRFEKQSFEQIQEDLERYMRMNAVYKELVSW